MWKFFWLYYIKRTTKWHPVYVKLRGKRKGRGKEKNNIIFNTFTHTNAEVIYGMWMFIVTPERIFVAYVYDVQMRDIVVVPTQLVNICATSYRVETFQKHISQKFCGKVLNFFFISYTRSNTFLHLIGAQGRCLYESESKKKRRSVSM